MKIGLLVMACAMVPATLSAQVLPGSEHVDGTRLSPREWTVMISMQRDGRTVVGGSTKFQLSPVPGAEPMWMLITTTTSQLGIAIDTSIARHPRLEPVSHRSHAVPRKLFLDYRGATVTGQYIPASGATRDIQRATDVPTFDGAMLDLVLGALPLAADYTTRLPFYIEEQEGLTWFDIAVTGDRRVGDVDGWVVRAANPKHTVEFVIGKKDRAFLAGRVQYPNGAVMDLTRG